MPQNLIEESSKLYEAIESNMIDQGYINWKYSVYEHFVRAGEIIIAKNLGNIKDAESLRNHYLNDRSFLYLPVILEELEKYNDNKEVKTYEEAIQNAIKKLIILAR